jgi:hypothetical protein
MHRRLDVERAGKCGREFATSFDPLENETKIWMLYFLANRRGCVKEVMWLQVHDCLALEVAQSFEQTLGVPALR